MKRRSITSPLLSLIAVAALAHAANATFDGDFSYFGYNLEFYSGTIPSIGETKSAGIGYGEIGIASDIFTASFSDANLERTIGNQFTANAETRCINTYSVELLRETEPGAGGIEPADNLVLNIYPDDEPEVMIPFHFSSNTNVALSIEGTGTNLTNEIGLGLLVRKGAGMDNSALDGTYVRYTLGNAAHGATANGWGNIDRISLYRSVMEFDGAGNVSETTSEWAIDRTTAETNIPVDGDSMVNTYCALSGADESTNGTSGTYSVLSDGTLLIPGDTGSITNQISPDGNLIASTLALGQEPYAETCFTVVVKQPENMPTNAVDAVYFIAEINEEFSSDSETEGMNNNTATLGRSYAFLESDGTFEIRADYWGVENTLFNHVFDNDAGSSTNLVAQNVFHTIDNEKEIEFESGTYTLQINGMVTFDFGNGDTGQAQLSENGEYLVLGFSYADEGGAERAMGIGIRRDPPPPPPSPTVFTNMAMTATGIVLSGEMPPNHPVESIYTANLANGTWESGGILSSPNGTLEIVDPSATNAAVRFYSATFAPW